MLDDYKIITEKEEWDYVLDKFEEKTIYFEYEYLDLHRSDSEVPFLLYINTDIGKMAYAFMLRDISYHDNLVENIDRNSYFDVSTPYGYGGHLIKPTQESFRTELIEIFYKKFGEFCKERKIVSEFIRFSPLLENHRDINKAIEVIFMRKVVSTKLLSHEDPLYSQVKKRKRNDANKLRRKGLQTVFKFSPKSFDKELEIYYDTMKRNNASHFYYFSKEYFNKMLVSLSKNILVVNVILDKKIIGFDLCFIYKNFIHSHLAGTRHGYLKYSPNDLSSVDIIKWGHNNGYKEYYTGGGVSNDEDDSLYSYKKAFAKNSDLNFYIGKKVWDQQSYDYLSSFICEDKDNDNAYFPKYRHIKKNYSI